MWEKNLLEKGGKGGVRRTNPHEPGPKKGMCMKRDGRKRGGLVG